MRIVRMRLTDLNPAEYNPRVRLMAGEQEYEDIKRSIETYGMVEPLVWNERTGNLVAGHQRYYILRDLGHEEEDVSVVDLTLEDEQLLNMALNRLRGRWDGAKLNELLGTLSNKQLPVQITGFSAQELTASLQAYQAAHAADFLKHMQAQPPLSPLLHAQPQGSAAGAALGTPPTVEDNGALAGLRRLTGDEEDDEDGEDGDEEATDTGRAWTPPASDGPAGWASPSPSTPSVQTEQPLYLNLTYTVTPEQREVIVAALTLAKRHFGVGTSQEALTNICSAFLAAAQNPVEV